MGIAGRIVGALIGERAHIPDELIARHPELAMLRLRRGGLPPHLGGLALGRATVDAITLRRTVFLARRTRIDPALLLHELRHAQQFFETRSFPLRYLWESVRRGYQANRFEHEARQYAARKMGSSSQQTSVEEG